MTEIGSFLLLIFRYMFILGSLFYAVFAFIVVKQTTNMSKNIVDKFNQVLVIFSYLHLAFAIFLIFLTFISL